MDIGKRFKHFRKKAGLTQGDAAKLIGVKYYQLGNYETNRSEPKIATLIKMAETYNVTIDQLVGKSILKQSNDSQQQTIDLSIDTNEISKALQEIIDKLNNSMK